MFTCNLDGAEFEDRDEAMDHLRDVHSGLISEELQDFTSEAEDRVFEGYINEREDS